MSTPLCTRGEEQILHCVQDDIFLINRGERVVQRLAIGGALSHSPPPTFGSRAVGKLARLLAAVLVLGSLLLSGSSAAQAGPIDGAAIIGDNGCLRCHSWEGVRVLDEGPSLDHAGDKLRAEWVDGFLKDPSATAMPVIDLSDSERATLTAFVAALRDDRSRRTAARGDSARGQQLYRMKLCRMCHKPGKRLLDLSHAAEKLKRDWLVTFLRDTVRTGPQARMPVYDFTQQDAEDVAEFVLGDAASSDPLPSGTEGLDLFVRKSCVTCHEVGQFAGAPMTPYLRASADLGVHRRGAPGVPRVVLSDMEEAALWRVLWEWIEPLEPGADSLPVGDLAGYWELPVARQGDPPDAWNGLERSLNASACGVCHPRQYFDWRESLHAKAYSPGFRAELQATADPRCLDCHAPLREQRDDLLLRADAVSCAGCHVRAHRRHGPPLPVVDLLSAHRADVHGGVQREPYFESAEFCVRCHQFEEGDAMLDDKLIMDTYNEWRASPAGREGKACQSCHMPDRRHLWRGIHDPQMVRENLTVEIAGREIRLTSLAGHRMPTYLVPRMIVSAWLEDAGGEVIAASRRSWTIQRHVILEGTAEDRELADTRLIPGETRIYKYDAVDPAGVTMAVAIDIEPDFYYRDLYNSRLANTNPDPDLRQLYEQALAEPQAPEYNLLTRRVVLE